MDFPAALRCLPSLSGLCVVLLRWRYGWCTCGVLSATNSVYRAIYCCVRLDVYARVYTFRHTVCLRYAAPLACRNSKRLRALCVATRWVAAYLREHPVHCAVPPLLHTTCTAGCGSVTLPAAATLVAFWRSSMPSLRVSGVPFQVRPQGRFLFAAATYAATCTFSWRENMGCRRHPLWLPYYLSRPC